MLGEQKTGCKKLDINNVMAVNVTVAIHTFHFWQLSPTHTVKGRSTSESWQENSFKLHLFHNKCKHSSKLV